jgi:hypothetical protein
MRKLAFTFPCLMLAACCCVTRQDDAGWSVRPDVLRDESIPELERLPCSAEATLRSTRADTQALVRFTNQRKDSVELFWLDYNGKRKSYGVIPAGQAQVMQTYLTHPWLIADSLGACLEIRMPDAGRYRITIS